MVLKLGIFEYMFYALHYGRSWRVRVRYFFNNFVFYRNAKSFKYEVIRYVFYILIIRLRF
jgi:hypothetical protein